MFEIAALSVCLGLKMAVQKTEAIVIRSYPLSDSSKILTFYTKEFGKVRAVAKGAKNTKSKFRGNVELLNHGLLVFFEKPNRDLQNVNEFDLINCFDQLKQDFDQTTYACYCSELVDAIESEGDANPDVFDLLICALKTLPYTKDIPLFARMFELCLLNETGYMPLFSHCIACSQSLTDVPAKFSDRLGGLICWNCRSQDLHSISISLESINLLKTLQQADISSPYYVQVSQQNHQELKMVLSSLIACQTQRQIKSLQFIENLK
ncbi:MAG: DNA repair protein RecO [Candidatus Poribacteria bacterium]|nr:DNA repair protein RecO [Candidatus Poribacteria bacterium]